MDAAGAAVPLEAFLRQWNFFHNRTQHKPDNYEPVVRKSEVGTRTSLNFEDKSRGSESEEEGPIARIYSGHERLRVAPRVATSRLLTVSFQLRHEITIELTIPKVTASRFLKSVFAHHASLISV